MKERDGSGAPDEELIRATLRGNERAFQGLVERYKARAFGVAVGIVGDRDDALDVVQESFVKAFVELHAAAALVRCGDREGLGARILSGYLDDWRGIFVRFAGHVLEKAALLPVQPPPPSGSQAPAWELK